LEYQRRGAVVKKAGKYQRYQCQACGKWWVDNRMLREQDNIS
jgi:transposase-like protein